MKKDAYYFPHFSNARTDSKILKLRRVMGIEGYGIYFMLLEVLREQTDFKLPISSIEDLEFEFRISKEKIAAVINNFDLFQIDNQEFFSPKLMFYLQPYLEKTERAREAANKRWLKSCDANAYANASANAMQGKERRVKESKVKESKVVELPDGFSDVWARWVEYKRVEKGQKYKSASSEQTAVNTLVKLSGGSPEIAGMIVDRSIANLWEGLFKLDRNDTNKSSTKSNAEQWAEWARTHRTD